MKTEDTMLINRHLGVFFGHSGHLACSEEPPCDWLLVAAGHVPQAPVLQRGVVYREPEAEQPQRLVIEEGAVLVRRHLAPCTRAVSEPSRSFTVPREGPY